MTQRINTLLPSLNAQRNMKSIGRGVKHSLKQISSGLRITSAKDDPAGLTIVEKMKGQVNGLNRAEMNAEDGISMFQTAEGALVETTSILHRMRELSVQASNGTLTQNDRVEIQKEVNQLTEEIDRISTSTEFNTKKLLDGSGAAVWSTDKPDKLNAMVRGKVAEGNYKIDIDRSGGEAQVWKSNVMNLKEGRSVDASLSVVTAGATDKATGVNYSSGAISEDLNIGYQFVKGQAAEIYGDATTGVDSITLSGTQNARFDGGAGTFEEVAGFVVTADLTMAFDIDGDTAEIRVNAGTVLTSATLTDLERTLSTAGITATFTFTSTGTAVKLNLEMASVTGTDTITFNSSAESLLGVSDQAWTTGAATVHITGAKEAENIKAFRVDVASAVATGEGALTFDISDGTNTAQVVLEGVATGYSTASGATSIYFSEQQVLDAINTALTGAGINATAEIDNDDHLNIVGSASVTSLQVDDTTNMPAKMAAATDTTNEVFGFSAGTEAQTADNKIKLSINGGATVTANISTADFNAATSAETRASIVENAINSALTTAGYAEADLVDVFASGDDALVMNSKKVGSGAEIDIEFGLQNSGNFLDKVGWDIQNHAQGDDEGMTLQAWDKDVSTSFAASAMTTHNWNTSEYATSGATNNAWSAGGASGITSVTVKDGYSAAQLSIQFTAAVTTTGGGTLQVNYNEGGTSYVAAGSSQLTDLSNFYNSEGLNILDEAQEFTIYGNDSSVTIALDKYDTLDNVVEKINDAITSTAGLSMTTGNSAVDSNAVSFVEVAGNTANSQEAVEGTMVLRSTVLGEAGKVSFAGSENLLKALGLSEIQEASDPTMTVSVTDAHDNTVSTTRFGSDSTYGNNVITNMIEGVDVEINNKVDVDVSWDSTNKEFDFSSSEDSESIYLHLVDNSVDLQIGANEGQIMNATIGQMDSKALGVSTINLADQGLAKEAMTTIDDAISTVSSERASMGAYMNRLEHTMNNLGVQKENINAARSGIEDLDMAKAMIEFTRQQSLAQAAQSMLAQANQLPQGVMQLVR